MSIPADRQKYYDWIGKAREAYSLGIWELADQRIMSLESFIAGALYDKGDKLHFKQVNVEAAIGALTVRALQSMVSSHPDAFQVLVVASWNTKTANFHRQMLATRELCLADTVGDLLSAALRASCSQGTPLEPFRLTAPSLLG